MVRVQPQAGGRAGIRPIDLALTAVVAALVELFVATASGPGQHPLDAQAYVFGAALTLPILFRRRWPLQVLIACSVLLIIYYAAFRRNIPPTPVLALPVYDAAVAGYLAWAVAVPAAFVTAGLVFAAASHRRLLGLAAEFLPRFAGVPVALWLLPSLIFPLAVVLGEMVRGRRALATETALRLRAAEDERQAEAARKVAEERLRIARELHDTVAHSMATIAVQAGSALHLLAGIDAGLGEIGGDGGEGRDAQVRDSLIAIRSTSKEALSDMRATLGQLRQPASAGLDRLETLRAAVVAAGLPLTVSVEGDEVPLPDAVGHAAYRILQESLTNVLKHAGRGACAAVRVCYGTAAITLEVTDDGGDTVERVAAEREHQGSARGHGIEGMAERATAMGGELTAGPRPEGGFAVTAHLPLAHLSPASQDQR